MLEMQQKEGSYQKKRSLRLGREDARRRMAAAWFLRVLPIDYCCFLLSR